MGTVILNFSMHILYKEELEIRLLELKLVKGSGLKNRLIWRISFGNSLLIYSRPLAPRDTTAVTRLIPRLINEEINASLLRQVEEEEIRNAVFSLGPQKALGPDGLTGVFFQNNWEVIKVEVIQAFLPNCKTPRRYKCHSHYHGP